MQNSVSVNDIELALRRSGGLEHRADDNDCPPIPLLALGLTPNGLVLNVSWAAKNGPLPFLKIKCWFVMFLAPYESSGYVKFPNVPHVPVPLVAALGSLARSVDIGSFCSCQCCSGAFESAAPNDTLNVSRPAPSAA